MKCPKCQAQNPETQGFCGECGTRIRGYVLDSPESGTCPQNSGLKDQVSVTKTLRITPEGVGRGQLLAGRFELIDELGAGGMGQVYRAYDKEVGEEIALKVLHPEIALDERTVDRFRNEIKLARKISHRNVCRLHELHQDRKQLFITMEYVPGQDLKGLIKESGALATGKAVSIAKQVAEGLAEAHDLGVIHRDLKPQNIMVDSEGLAKIMDFGIARSLRAAGRTAEGLVIGTPEYMAPEQVEGLEADQRTDIYALGAILFEMLTGRVPFEGDTPLSVAYKHKNEKPIPPRKLNMQIPEPFNQLILRCLEKEKENRYQTPDELISDLVRIEDGLPISERVVLKSRPTIRITREKQIGLRRPVVPVLAFVGLAIAAFIVWRFVVRKAVTYPSPIENSIAVISFENQTGDPANDIYRKSIPSLLITNLENSGLFGYVATQERMQDLLKQIGNKDVEFIDADFGFEACRREGIKAIILGSFVKAGEIFVTDVKVLDVETKQLLKSASSKGEGQESILRTQIDELSRKIAAGVGLSAQAVDSASWKMADITTSSPEAYNYFVRGKDEHDRFNWQDARRFLEKAVEIDPDFASAYRVLSEVSRRLGNTGAQNEYLKKALSLSSKTTEKESLYIHAAAETNAQSRAEAYECITAKYPLEKEAYYWQAWCYQDIDQRKAVEAAEKALKLDPAYSQAVNLLGCLYLHQGIYDRGLEWLKKYLALSPGDPNPLDSLGAAYFGEGNLDEAAERFKEALDLDPNFSCGWKIAYIYALKEAYPEAIRWLDRGIANTSSPGIRLDSYNMRAFLRSWLGDSDTALMDLDRALEEAKACELTNFEYQSLYLKAWILYDRGNMEAGEKFWNEYLDNVKRGPNYSMTFVPMGSAVAFDTCFYMGLCAQKRGQIDKASDYLSKMKTLLPDVPRRLARPFHGQAHYDILEGEIKLALKTADKAVETCERTPPWINLVDPFLCQYSSGEINHYIVPFLKDILARAYKAAGLIDEAIEEYERLVTFDPRRGEQALIHPLYHYRLGLLYGQKGMKDKARAEYRRFLDLWKDADPGTPEVEDAKKRLAGLT